MNEKVMRFENKRDKFFYKKKQKQKNMICNLKKHIFLLLFFGWFFGFPFQRCFVEL
jgi:hypothetical protein